MKIILHKGKPRHDYLFEKSRITLSIWSNLVIRLEFDVENAFSMIVYNLSAYILPVKGENFEDQF